VTAPTNKAVAVLAQRFLDATNSMDNYMLSNANPVLVGVEDKLVNDEEQYYLSDAMTTSLRNIFAYTWIESAKTELLALLVELESFNNKTSQQSDVSIGDLINRAKRMQHQILCRIPSSSSGCSHDMNGLVKKLTAAAAARIWEESDDVNLDTSKHLVEDAILHGKTMLSLLEEIDSSDAVTELVSTARVIFCTLSTAGSSILKQTRHVDDLLVDEAAAATEAEICIPFHLRPERLLCVGDPQQLPPTIISRRASELGLSKSMHDRLMNDCDEEYFMLVRRGMVL
jgi:hypothetical protein